MSSKFAHIVISEDSILLTVMVDSIDNILFSNKNWVNTILILSPDKTYTVIVDTKTLPRLYDNMKMLCNNL